MESTCWTVVRGAAVGRAEDREIVARRYVPIIRAYLAARWRNSSLNAEVEDATHEVLFECFRQGGILEKAESERPGGFRAFLYGAARNVALRFEKRRGQRREVQAPTSMDVERLHADDADLGSVFDREWARALMKEAGERQEDAARKKGPAALRRIELLRLRFQEDRPIREIAALWNVDTVLLHHEYAQARKEFRMALEEVVAFYNPHSRSDAERECASLLALLQ